MVIWLLCWGAAGAFFGGWALLVIWVIRRLARVSVKTWSTDMSDERENERVS